MRDAGIETVDAGISCDACGEGTLLNAVDCSCEDIDECLEDNGGCDSLPL